LIDAVRKTYQIDADKITITNPLLDNALQALVGRVANEMNCGPPENIQ